MFLFHSELIILTDGLYLSIDQVGCSLHLFRLSILYHGNVITYQIDLLIELVKEFNFVQADKGLVPPIALEFYFD